MNPTACRMYVSIRVDQEPSHLGSLNLNHEFRTATPLTMEKTALLLQKFSELCRAIEAGKEIQWIEKGGGK